MYEEIEEWVDAELHPLLAGGAMTKPLRDMTDDEVIQAWTMLRFASSKIGDRLNEIREVLLEDAAEFGSDTDKGGQRLYIGRHLILREKRVSKLPRQKDFKELLEKANLKNSEAFTKKTTTVLDASKIQNLINLGKLSEEDVEGLKKVTWALRVKPDEGLEAILDEAFGEGEEELPDVPVRPKRGSAEGDRKS